MTTQGSPETATPTALVAAISGSFSSVLPVFLTAALATQIAVDLSATPEQVVATGSTLFLWSAILSVPGGRIADRVGGRNALLVSLVLSSVCLVTIATAARSSVSLLLAVIVGGAANALALPSGNALLLRHAVPRRHGLVYGIKQSAIPAASLLSGATLTIVGGRYAWRSTFVVAGLLSLALAAGTPRRRLAHTSRAPASPPPSGASGTKGVASLAVAAGLASAGATATATYLVTSAIRAGLSPGGAGVVLVVASAAGISVRVMTGAALDRWGPRSTLVGTLIALGGAGTLLLAPRHPALSVIGALIALGAGWGWQGLLQHHVSVSYAAVVGRASGAVQAGLAGGAVGGPVAFGIVASTASYTVAWSLTAMSAMAAGVAMRKLLASDAGLRPPLRAPGGCQ
jgi:predicted MFS family arabinose efflux permease